MAMAAFYFTDLGRMMERAGLAQVVCAGRDRTGRYRRSTSGSSAASTEWLPVLVCYYKGTTGAKAYKVQYHAYTVVSLGIPSDDQCCEFLCADRHC